MRLFAVDFMSGGSCGTAELHTFDIGSDGTLTEVGQPYDTSMSVSDGPASVLVPAQPQ